MEKKFKKILLILIFIIIIILSILLIIKLIQKNDKLGNQTSKGDVGEVIDYNTTQLENVSDKINYYTVRNCINSYLNSINAKNSIYYIGNEYNEEIHREYVYNLLSKEYIQEHNITTQNIFKTINTVNDTEIFTAINMKVLKKEDLDKYLVYGIVQNSDNKFIKKLYIFVNIDPKNKTYSIEPIDDSYNSIEDIKVTNSNVSIEKNDNNAFNYQKITNEYCTNEYFVLYKKLALSYPDALYDMMSSDYRDKRFGSLDKFKEYINQNSGEWAKINLTKYLVNNYDEYIEYVAKDQYENLYIFDEYNQNQKVVFKLDTYTITTDKFKETYNSAQEEKRVQMNIDKFFQMINRQDYTNSYNCLDDSFKNNYYSSEKMFSNYIKNNFYRYNKVAYKSVEEEGNNIYAYKIELSDITGENSDTKTVTIIMKLEDDMNFKMSFSM